MAAEQLPNLYNVLELTPLAGRSEIVDALHRLRSIYGADSDASYALFSTEDRQKILSDLDLAEYHLLDTDRRTRYDREILGIGGTRHELPPPPMVTSPVQNHSITAMGAQIETARMRQPIGFRPPEQPGPVEVAPPILVGAATPVTPLITSPSIVAPAQTVAPQIASEIKIEPTSPVSGRGGIPHTVKNVPAPKPVEAVRPSAGMAIPVIPADRPKPDPAGFFAELNDYTGKNLRRYREATGISLREISAITRVPPQHLENIESDDFAHLPAPVYLKGFLKSYCKILGLNSPTVVDGYMNHVRIYSDLHRK